MKQQKGFSMQGVPKAISILTLILLSSFCFGSDSPYISPVAEAHSEPLVEQVDSRALASLSHTPGVSSNKTSSFVRGDYDGDGKADFVVRDPANFSFYIQLSKDNAIKQLRFGLNQNDIPLVGDFDGDSKTDIAFRRTSNATWNINRSSKNDDNDVYQYRFGLRKTDIPVPADYDGDGLTDFAIRRPETRTWYIRKSSTGEVISLRFGLQASDIPVPADYDGDGKADFLWRNEAASRNIIHLMDGTAVKSRGVLRPTDNSWQVAK